MRKIGLAIALAIGVTTFTFAQRGSENRPSPEEMATKRAEKMKEKLNLSEDQFQQVLELNKEKALEQAAKRKEFKKANKEEVDREAHKEAREAEKAAYEEELGAILTPSQLEQFKAEQKDSRGDKMNSKKKGKSKDARAVRSNKDKGDRPTAEEVAIKKATNLKEKLGLSEAQYQQVLELNTTAAVKREADQKRNREAMKAEREAFKNKLNAILTAEQQAKLEAMNGSRNKRQR